MPAKQHSFWDDDEDDSDEEESESFWDDEDSTEEFDTSTTWSVYIGGRRIRPSRLSYPEARKLWIAKRRKYMSTTPCKKFVNIQSDK